VKTAITAGAIPFTAAFAETGFRTRSKAGRTESIRMNDDRKIAIAAITAPATPASL
jgi:hypothetical protein